MLCTPSSELPQLGRSRLYLWTLLAFVLLQLPTGFAVEMPIFLVFRGICGFFGNPSLMTAAAATIGDMYDPARTAYGVCIWAAFGIGGPVLVLHMDLRFLPGYDGFPLTRDQCGKHPVQES